MNLIDNLTKHKLELPELSVPRGSYVSVNTRGNIAYVAIQFPIKNEVYLYQGKLGNVLNTQDGYKAMELCALNVIAQIHAKVGFENVIGLNHIDAYYQSSKNWDDA
ncbi:RidA family protein, partial [Winogradskyella sp.]|uniref:RidA family protein n=1 Tax=Winogradskyella sp. TaxID=1883156 RepID=UPI0025FD4821